MEAKAFKNNSRVLFQKSFFSKYEQDVFDLFSDETLDLVGFKTKAIIMILKWLELNVKIFKSSDLNVTKTGTERLVDIVKSVGSDRYVCGAGADNYQDDDLFIRDGIVLEKNKFIQPTYSQLWGEFSPGLSIIDLIFNCGPKSGEILNVLNC